MIGLDMLRQMGVIYGWLPSDTPILFGKMVTGGAPFAVMLSAEVVVHYLNGANFGLFYAFVWGETSVLSQRRLVGHRLADDC